MPENVFDIYQTEAGYTAVTSHIRRAILDALTDEGPGDLARLVEVTGRAKPTLSGVHMKELLAQNLVEEVAHPTDSRRKLYRVKGRKIGSSNIPVDQLRGAVKHYVSLSPLAARLPLAASLEAIAAAPADASEAHLREQAARLGSIAAELFTANGSRDLLIGLVDFLEREGLAESLNVDLEHLSLDVALGQALSSRVSPRRWAEVLAGFVQGVAEARTGHEGTIRAEVLEAGARRVRFQLDTKSDIRSD